jgi:peptidoglycan/LPS O-acetylase OafA/YrhL
MREHETFPSLTGLRFILAAWISVYHLSAMYGPPGVAEFPLLAVGNARVDIFFVLSGFVLAHVYAVRPKAQAGGFDFGAFMIARIARLYPLHLLALGILGVAVAAATLLGRTKEAAQFTLEGLVANLFMLQATAFPKAAAWNFPAWTLSAEAFGYLLFPLFIGLGTLLRGRALAFWALGLLITAGVGLVWPLKGDGPLSEATQIWGIGRGALCMLVGVGARYAFETVRLGLAQAVALTGAGALLVGGAAIAGFDLWLVAMGASILIFGIAAIDRTGAPTPLSHPVMVRLGTWSYALFILHVPLFIIMERGLGLLGWDGVLNPIMVGVFLGVVLAVSWPAHVLFEEPARRAIRGIYKKRERKSDGPPGAEPLKSP